MELRRRREALAEAESELGVECKHRVLVVVGGQLGAEIAFEPRDVTSSEPRDDGEDVRAAFAALGDLGAPFEEGLQVVERRDGALGESGIQIGARLQRIEPRHLCSIARAPR